MVREANQILMDAENKNRGDPQLSLLFPRDKERGGRKRRLIPSAESFIFLYLIPESPLHLSTYPLSPVCLSASLPLIRPSLLAFSLPSSHKEHLLFVHAPKCLQHPALYLQSMWDARERITFV